MLRMRLLSERGWEQYANQSGGDEKDGAEKTSFS
jgi:hypothetical protein